MTDDSRPFWQTTALCDMTVEQFESICDGCARCCLHKLEDEDSGQIVFTDVACRLLDTQTCRCKDYARRTERVEGCVSMAPDRLEPLAFLPDSCAYRRLDEGRGLADWHPLVSGKKGSVHHAGVSMRDHAVSETFIAPDDIAQRIRSDIDWTPRSRTKRD